MGQLEQLIAQQAIDKGGGALSGGGAPQAGGGMVDPQQLKQLYQMLIQPHKELTEPAVDPRQKSIGLGATLGTSILSMFLPAVGGALQGHMRRSKEAQINEAHQDFKQLHDSLEEAW